MAELRWSPEPGQADLLAVVQDASTLLELTPARLDLALRLLRTSRLIGRVAWRLRAAGLMNACPEVVRSQLESALVVVEARTREIRWELDRIALALEDLPDVPVVALKGCGYLLAGTPNADGRVFADVDLMVPDADLARVEGQLHLHGWQTAQVSAYDDRYYRVWSHEIPPMKHPEREIELDLHHNVVMRTARLKPSAHSLLASSRLAQGTGMRVLAPADMVLHAMVHLFFGGELKDCLRELVDIRDLIEHFAASDPGFWDRLVARSAELGLVEPAFQGLRYACGILGLRVPESVHELLRTESPPRRAVAVMDRVVPAALFPVLDEGALSSRALACQLAYVRSHWIRMPPLMLARHLSRKFWARCLGS